MSTLCGLPSMKECFGDGHVVQVEDVINGPEWTCMDLEKLDIVICVPFRINLDFVQRLDRARSSTRFTSKSSAEKAALAQQEASHTIQRQVHARLVQLINPTDISFGNSYDLDSRHHMIYGPLRR
ncbi:hypothetical protein BGZ95_002876 [Linnemannia exigua]|uniref:Uncharacterized protein n=1 Tax=Linnemannia exigua TaxID=604196 RepID=A0AAD4DID2_9FUNG|nr:hypothetical protein BGZ95_002876 [Linnemannia exigua]